MSHYGWNFCQKCHAEDDRCDHKITLEDREALLYVDTMPRYSQGNSVYRYTMYLLFKEALDRRLPTRSPEPKQVERTYQ